MKKKFKLNRHHFIKNVHVQKISLDVENACVQLEREIVKSGMLTQAQQVNLTSSRFNQDNMNLPSTVTFTQVISDQLRPIKPSRLTAASRLNALA